MSELRFNSATGEWIIVAPIREKGNLKSFSCLDLEPEHELEYQEDCPFCEGNEWMTLPEASAVRDDGSLPNEPGWKVRVVPDKFPALSRIRSGITRQEDEFFMRVEGYGIHENIIESPKHNDVIPSYSRYHLEIIIRVMVQRYRLFETDPKISHISIFKNKGKRAGATLVHPHSQIIASPYVPPLVERHVRVAESYYQKNKKCVFCRMIEKEQEAESRIVADNKRFLAIHPFASKTPFETWIIPKKHRHRFGSITTHGIEELAGMLKDVINATEIVSNVPDYHLVISSSPMGDRYEKSYHWHLQYIPRRMPSTAGEMNTGVSVTTIAPETSAKRVKEQIIVQSKGTVAG